MRYVLNMMSNQEKISVSPSVVAVVVVVVTIYPYNLQIYLSLSNLKKPSFISVMLFKRKCQRYPFNVD